MKIDKPGVYDLTDDQYHADPTPEPSLSSSIAKILLTESPRHAWMAHPRLNPKFEREHSNKFDIGSAAHELILRGDEARFVIVDAENYKTKAAQEAKADAYAAGAIPLLPPEYEAVKSMAGSARAQLKHHREASDAFTTGKPEQTLIWQERGVWCRCKLDWLPAGGNVFYDLKTTGGSANPEEFGRKLFDLGYDVQAAFYRRGIRAVLGIEEPHFRFIVQETAAPYALSVVQIAPASMGVADRKVGEALSWWAWCLKNDAWPGYPARVAHVEMPPWAEARWNERELRRDSEAENGQDMKQTMIDWQSPNP